MGHRSEAVVAHEPDLVVRAGPGGQAPQPLVEHPVHVTNVLGHGLLGQFGVVGMVGGQVLGKAVLHPVGGEVHAAGDPPVRGVQKVLHGPLAGRGHLHHLPEERFRPVAIGGPGHPVDRPGDAGLPEVLGQALRMGERPPLGQHPAGDELAPDGRRGEGQGDVDHERLDPRSVEILQERPFPDRAEGHRELPGPTAPLQDVVDPMAVRIHAGEERRPGRPGVRGDRGREGCPSSPLDEGGQVGEDAPLQQRVEDAPVGAVPADEEDPRGHVRNQGSLPSRGRKHRMEPGGLTVSRCRT